MLEEIVDAKFMNVFVLLSNINFLCFIYLLDKKGIWTKIGRWGSPTTT